MFYFPEIKKQFPEIKKQFPEIKIYFCETKIWYIYALFCIFLMKGNTKNS